MADPAPKPTDNPLQTEANDRLKEARRWKAPIALDCKEALFFSAPHRRREVLSTSKRRLLNTTSDASEAYTDFAILLCADFTTEIVNTYLPEAQDWCERKAGENVKEEDFDTVAEDVRAADRKIFGAIRASNFYAEIAKAVNPELAIAGAGLFIHRPHAHAPIQVLAVPMHEAEWNLGPDGEIDDRFIVRFTRNSYVQKLIGETAWAKTSAETKKAISEKPSDDTEVRWGWWRLWNDISDEVWQHVIMIKSEMVHDVKIKGEGCCPYIPMRFNPSSDFPWAAGPLIQGLPTVRQINDWERQIPECIERSFNGPVGYPSDDIASVEQGLESGMAYPISPGRAIDIKPIYEQRPVDPGLADLERKEHRLRKLFYVDHPEQTGDTPPTLGQWLDELARMQRRIGTAGYSFWREGPMRIFLRFKYLLEADGVIPNVVKDKSGRAISTQPYNPAQRAAEQQEIATANQCAQILGTLFPEEFKLWMDGKKSMQAFIKKMRTSKLLILRDEQEVEQALGRIKQLVAGRNAPGGEVPPDAGAPAAA